MKKRTAYIDRLIKERAYLLKRIHEYEMWDKINELCIINLTNELKKYKNDKN